MTSTLHRNRQRQNVLNATQVEIRLVVRPKIRWTPEFDRLLLRLDILRTHELLVCVFGIVRRDDAVGLLFPAGVDEGRAEDDTDDRIGLSDRLTDTVDAHGERFEVVDFVEIDSRCGDGNAEDQRQKEAFHKEVLFCNHESGERITPRRGRGRWT